MSQQPPPPLHLQLQAEPEAKAWQQLELAEETFNIRARYGSLKWIDATVFYGVEKQTFKRVAIKIFPTQNEIHILQLLEKFPHPRICGVHQIESHVLVMDWQKTDLYRAIGRLHHQVPAPKREKFSKKVAKQLLEAIAHCHELGICHRDIKPENVLLASDPFDGKRVAVFLADFGVSVMVPDLQNMTRRVGSNHYLPPEIWKGESYGLEIDLWSFGVLMYVILAGRFPFGVPDGPIEDVEVARVLDGEYGFPEGMMSADAQRFIARFLEVVPTQRMSAKQGLNHPWLAPMDAVVEGVAVRETSHEDVGALAVVEVSAVAGASAK